MHVTQRCLTWSPGTETGNRVGPVSCRVNDTMKMYKLQKNVQPKKLTNIRVLQFKRTNESRGRGVF